MFVYWYEFEHSNSTGNSATSSNDSSNTIAISIPTITNTITITLPTITNTISFDFEAAITITNTFKLRRAITITKLILSIPSQAITIAITITSEKVIITIANTITITYYPSLVNNTKGFWTFPIDWIDGLKVSFSQIS